MTANSAGDLLAAVAVSGNPGSVRILCRISQMERSLTSSHSTAEREIVVNVAVEALTAGKLVIFVEYVIGL